MNPILAAGLLIGVLCVAWTFVMGFAGWYKDPVMAMNAFLPVVILIETCGLLWGLRRTAAQGRTYSGQVVAGTLMSIVAGTVIIAGSLFFTTVAFPQYFEEINEASRQLMTREGKTEAEIAEAVNAVAPWQTPLANAFAGLLGTFITGVIISAVAAIWIRARSFARTSVTP
jgi:hypothetical protein